MILRAWQQAAINAALTKYRNPFTHFLCLATPGAGKTVMASTLANILIKENKVDLVLCFSPSTTVANDFRVELEAFTKKRFCGGLGATGSSLTYQSMRFLGPDFWLLFENYRVFVIFDEIHHCAGRELEDANAWGAEILKHIQGKATFTLALTGTPWRSDTTPIALASYTGENNRIHVDYRYGLKQAIKDGVCRTPHITLLDNDRITVLSGDDKKHYKSISEFIEQSLLSYSELIGHVDVMRQVLKKGIIRLNDERITNSNAGGLIVAASIEHAKKIQTVLAEFDESSKLVTYRENHPDQLIQEFKTNTEKWIISIGMISEGTNIPRLRVCCYLSLVTTELYFRQVLGRVLRAQYSESELGYFITPAHPKLLEFARRVSEELPHTIFNKDHSERDEKYSETREPIQLKAPKRCEEERIIKAKVFVSPQQALNGKLNSWYESNIDSFGRYQQKVYML